MKKVFIFILLIMLFGSATNAAQRPVFDPLGTIDWYFFGDTFEWKNKLCNCKIGDAGVVQAGFEVSFYEPIALSDVTTTPWNFPSIGMSLEDGLGRKQGVAREAGNTSGFKYTHFVIYPIFSVLNLITDWICFERLSVLSFGFMSEVNPAHNNDSIAAFMSPQKLLFALASPSCIMDCAATTIDEPINSMYFCAGCWQPLGTNTGWTDGKHPARQEPPQELVHPSLCSPLPCTGSPSASR